MWIWWANIKTLLNNFGRLDVASNDDQMVETDWNKSFLNNERLY